MRYPTLIPYQRCPIGMDHGHHARIRRAVDGIVNRTGVMSWIDVRKRIVVFGYRRADDTIDLLDIGCPLFRDRRMRVGAGFDPVLDKHSADEVVSLVRNARVDPRVKARWRGQAKANVEHDKKEAMGAFAADGHNRREAWRKVEHRYQQHSMGSRYRKTVAMS